MLAALWLLEMVSHCELSLLTVFSLQWEAGKLVPVKVNLVPQEKCPLVIAKLIPLEDLETYTQLSVDKKMFQFSNAH